MYVYPNRTSGKSSKWYIYTLLAIDGIIAFIFNAYAMLFLIVLKFKGLPILLVTFSKAFAVYTCFRCLIYPEKVKPNRTYYLSIVVINTSVNSILCIIVLLEAIMAPSGDGAIFMLLLYMLIIGLVSASGWMVLLHIRDLVN